MFLPPSKGIEFGPGDPTWDETCRWVISGSDGEFAALLQTGPDLSKSYGWGEVSLCEIAVACDAVGKLGQLFAAGANPFQIKSDNPHAGSSLLHAAAYHGSADCLKYLLSIGLAIDQRGGLQTTPLMEACAYGHLALVEILLASGASVHAENEFGETALNLLADNHWKDSSATLPIIQLLHHHGANLNHVNHLRDGVVTGIADVGHVEALRWLLEHGADPNQHSSEGTALRRAVLNDDLISMELLLNAGADPNVRLEDDETVLFDVKSAESVRLLLKYGADPELKDDLFDRIAVESMKDPLIRAAFPTDPNRGAED